MKKKVQLNRFFPMDRFELFDFFVTPSLLELWAYPDKMSLRVPFFESRVGGNYRYEHQSENGLFVCTGVIKEFITGEKLIQHDYEGTDPQGKKIFSDLECIIKFRSKLGGTEMSLLQIGFKNEATAKDCESGWTQCLNHLQNLINDRNSLTEDQFRGTESNLGG